MRQNKLIERDFSLLELLVVIAVIGILAGLLFPAIMSVKEKSKKSACMNNLRQIGQALNMYLPDNNFYMPYCTMLPSSPPPGEENFPAIQSVIMPYLKEKDVLLCPSDPGRKYFLKEGISYEWESSFVNGRKVDEKSFTILGFKLFIMMDYDNFHGSASSPGAKNYLYLNARVAGQLEQ